MNYRYEFAGLNIRISLPYEIRIGKESEPFITLIEDGSTEEESGEESGEDIVLEMRYAETVVPLGLPEHGHWVENVLYSVEEDIESVYFCSSRAASAADAVISREIKSRNGNKTDTEPYSEASGDVVNKRTLLSGCFDLTRLRMVNQSNNICDFLQFETILSLYNGFWLHASHISRNGKGILFTAPSGVGKSTQADLWVRYEGASVINGDKTAVRKTEGAWRGFGLPFAGSSDVYRNESTVIAAIVCLEQAPENRIRRMRPSEAFRLICAQTAIHQWDHEFVERVTGTILEAVQEIPVYLLSCTPDRGAVMVLKNVIE